MTEKRGELTAEPNLSISSPQKAMENIYGRTPH